MEDNCPMILLSLIPKITQSSNLLFCVCFSGQVYGMQFCALCVMCYVCVCVRFIFLCTGLCYAIVCFYVCACVQYVCLFSLKSIFRMSYSCDIDQPKIILGDILDDGSNRHGSSKQETSSIVPILVVSS